MEKANMKTAGAVVVVLIIVLLFSWQYVGNGEKSSMEGDWTLAGYKAMAMMGPVGAEETADEPTEINVSVSGDIATMTDGVDTVRFYLTSDHEAVSIDYGYNMQMYLHGEMLYVIAYMHTVVKESTFTSVIAMAYSHDGTYDIGDDQFDFDGSGQSVTAQAYNSSNAAVHDATITFYVNEEEFRAVHLVVDVDGILMETLGFIMGDPNAYTIFCMTSDGTVFNLTAKNNVITTVTGVDTVLGATQYYVYDRNGSLSKDIYGLNGKSAIFTAQGLEKPVNGFYEDGRLCDKKADGSTYLFAVTAQCVDGHGFALGPTGQIIVSAEGKLWQIDCHQLI